MKRLININDDAKLKPFFGKFIRDNLEMGKQDQARLREAILAKATITPQDHLEVAVTFFHSIFVNLARTAAVLILVFAGFSGIVYASGRALPGTILYGVKIAKEAVELKLANTPQKKAYVEAKQAETRLEELQALDKANTAQTAPAVERQAHNDTDQQVNQAISSLQSVESNLKNQGDTEQAAAVNSRVQNISQQAKQLGVNVQEESESRGQTTNPSLVQTATSTPQTEKHTSVETSKPRVVRTDHSTSTEQTFTVGGQSGESHGDGQNTHSAVSHSENSTATSSGTSTIVASTTPSSSLTATSTKETISTPTSSSTTTPSHTESGDQTQNKESSGTVKGDQTTTSGTGKAGGD